MQQNNRASNARYLGPIVFGEIKSAPEDQYQPMSPLFVEETEKKRENTPHQWRGQMIGSIAEYTSSEQEPDPEGLPDQDWVVNHLGARYKVHANRLQL
jgi:hypothetical protein